MIPFFRRTVTTVRLGRLNPSQANNTIDLANFCQPAFDISGLREPSFDLTPYRMENGAFDLDRAALALLRQESLETPLIVLTDEPYGDPAKANDADEIYFFGELTDQRVVIISTHLWFTLGGTRSLQPYLLYMIATAILTLFAELSFHDESRGCVLDYCDHAGDLDKALHHGSLCEECRDRVAAGLRSGKISLAEVAAATRLINRARGVRQAFIAMPFTRAFQRTYTDAIKPALDNVGWQVTRADDYSTWPRIITDAIMLGILSADLLVAEVTSGSPNVYYEIGVADALRIDLILLARKKSKLPFDVENRRAIFYPANRLSVLRTELQRMAGRGRL